MLKQEFLEGLKSQLSGELSDAQVQSHLSYYERYIADETAKGKTEEEVIGMLGDPRLIAKTLIDTNISAGPGVEDMGSQESEDIPKVTPVFHWLDLSTWYGKALAILLTVGIIALVVTIISAMLPFLLVLAVIGIVIIYLKKRR